MRPPLLEPPDTKPENFWTARLPWIMVFAVLPFVICPLVSLGLLGISASLGSAFLMAAFFSLPSAALGMLITSPVLSFTERVIKSLRHCPVSPGDDLPTQHFTDRSRFVFPEPGIRRTTNFPVAVVRSVAVPSRVVQLLLLSGPDKASAYEAPLVAGRTWLRRLPCERVGTFHPISLERVEPAFRNEVLAAFRPPPPPPAPTFGMTTPGN